MQNIIGNWVRGLSEKWDFPNLPPNTGRKLLLLSLGSLPGHQPSQHSGGPGALLYLIVLLPLGRKALREVASREEGL